MSGVLEWQCAIPGLVQEIAHASCGGVMAAIQGGVSGSSVSVCVTEDCAPYRFTAHGLGPAFRLECYCLAAHVALYDVSVIVKDGDSVSKHWHHPRLHSIWFGMAQSGQPVGALVAFHPWPEGSPQLVFEDLQLGLELLSLPEGGGRAELAVNVAVYMLELDRAPTAVELLNKCGDAFNGSTSLLLGVPSRFPQVPVGDGVNTGPGVHGHTDIDSHGRAEQGLLYGVQLSHH